MTGCFLYHFGIIVSRGGPYLDVKHSLDDKLSRQLSKMTIAAHDFAITSNICCGTLELTNDCDPNFLQMTRFSFTNS